MTEAHVPDIAPGLRGLSLRRRYSSGRADLVTEFFAPCVSRSVAYDRAVGFFSSSLYLLVGIPVAQFARQGGEMRLVCCPRLSPQDIEAMALGYESRSTGDALVRELEDALEDPVGHASATLLASLIAHGALEVRIAFRPGRRGIFHDKVGIFKDHQQDAVSFGGSANESWSAWALGDEANHESFHAFSSWVDGERVSDDIAYFDSLWDSNEPNLAVQPFPEVARDRLQEVAKEDLEDAERALADVIARRRSSSPKPALRRHQSSVLADWRLSDHRGLVEHATGSGKTITALSALDEALSEGKVAVILVPSVLLQLQWQKEMESFLGDGAPQLLLAGGGHSEWRDGATLRNFCTLGSHRRAVLAVMDTAASEAFVGRIFDLPNLFLLADEVHRLGSTERQRALTIDADWRMGLSATWRREGDSAGTAAILEYFQRVLEPVYTLADAVREGWLCPYRYAVHFLSLAEDEQQVWRDLSRRVAQALGGAEGDLSEGARLLLLKRSRIIKKAARKPALAGEVLAANHRRGDAWLVYCDDTEQLLEVRRAIEAHDLRCFEYHTAMSGDGAAALAEFERSGGIMLAIRCLDEGIDIPRISHALILASSSTRRGFIQRRGRVLRIADRKFRAVIHDVLVDAEGFDDPATATFVRSELARALEFCGPAVDSAATRLRIERRLRELPVLPEMTEGDGIEEDVEDDG